MIFHFSSLMQATHYLCQPRNNKKIIDQMMTSTIHTYWNWNNMNWKAY